MFKSQKIFKHENNWIRTMNDLQNTKLKRRNIGKDYVKDEHKKSVEHLPLLSNSLTKSTFSIFFAFFSLSLFFCSIRPFIKLINPATWWLSSIDPWSPSWGKTMNVEVRSRVFDQEAGSTLSSLRDGDPSTQRLFRCIPYELDLNPLRIVSFIPSRHIHIYTHYIQKNNNKKC